VLEKKYEPEHSSSHHRFLLSKEYTKSPIILTPSIGKPSLNFSKEQLSKLLELERENNKLQEELTLYKTKMAHLQKERDTYKAKW